MSIDIDAPPLKLDVNASDISRRINDIVTQTNNYSELLPLIFRFEARPVSLKEHFFFERCFYAKRPRKQIKKCGRQVGKSFQNALEMLTRGLFTPYWNQLFVTPLQEQVKRFSQQYINVLISESPVKRMFAMKGASNRVFSRTLRNGSSMTFSYALKDANRARGVQANEVIYDEFQLMFRDVLYVLQSTMGASPYGEYEMFSGTPLSFGNVLNTMWNDSSMGEWVIKCPWCNYYNVPSYEKDLVKMIGPVHDGIHKGGYNKAGQKITRMPGLVCARCSPHNNIKNLKPIYPEHGRWMHKAPERTDDFLGLHISQPITPRHAYSKSRWSDLIAKIRGGNEAEILNELLGEPCDAGFKPITEYELRRAACLSHNNKLEEALRIAQYYEGRLAMGIDWGGGGLSGISRTKMAIVGLSNTGKTDVLFGIDFGATSNVFDEVDLITIIAAKFGVTYVAHDAGGGMGTNKEAMMRQCGIDDRIVKSVFYTGPMGDAMIKPRPAQEPNRPTTYSLDKSRSLTFACQAIKQGHLRFFQYDYVSQRQQGLLNDFLALTTDIDHNPKASDRLFVDREDGMSDDFAHAVNFASVILWSHFKAYPNLSFDLARQDITRRLGGVDLVRKAKDLTAEQINEMVENMMFSVAN